MIENEIHYLFEQWADYWNKQDIKNLHALYAEDVELYQAPAKKSLIGWGHIASRAKDFWRMSNDARFSVRELHIAGDTVIMEFNARGTNDGPFLDYAPTGRKFDIDSCLIFKLEEGKIIKHTTYLDTATILRALGLVTLPIVRPEAA